MTPIDLSPLTSGERSLLARFARERGEIRAGDLLGLNRLTLVRAIAGLQLRHGTLVLVRARLPFVAHALEMPASHAKEKRP